MNYCSIASLCVHSEGRYIIKVVKRGILHFADFLYLKAGIFLSDSLPWSPTDTQAVSV